MKTRGMRGKLSDEERRRLLATFDRVIGQVPRRQQSEVDAELKAIRAARRKGGRQSLREPRPGQ